MCRVVSAKRLGVEIPVGRDIPVIGDSIERPFAKKFVGSVIKETQTGDDAVTHRADGEVAVDVLLGFEHPVAAVGRKLVVTGDIVCTDVVGVTRDGGISEDVKVRAGTVGVTVGYRYIGLCAPPAVKGIMHLAEEIGVGK